MLGPVRACENLEVFRRAVLRHYETLRTLLAASILLSAAALLVRAWIGPYFLVRSPMNAESIFALASLLLLAIERLRDKKPAWPSTDAPFVLATHWCVAAILILVGAAFWHSLSMPFVFDDYTHVTNVLSAGPNFWKDQFTVRSGDGFFRPLGFYEYRLDSIWTGRNPYLWRLANLVAHAANCVLVFFLGRRLGLASWTATFAALLFGWHGSRPEAAGWVAARFDLLATLFVLAGLLLLDRYQSGRQASMLALALAMCLCGLLSKEEAYVFPLLATLLFWRRISWRVLAGFYALAAMVFAYRWKLLGGIGGYETSNSQPTIFILNASGTVKALLLRLWAVLWFPIDWAVQPGSLLALAATAMLAAGVWLFMKRPALHGRALGFTLIAALPVQHLLLIGADLEKSRVLYLPSVGFAILVGFALQSVPQPRMAAIAGVAILIFQLAALEHNLAIWSRITELSRQTCERVGIAVHETGRDAIVTDLPKILDGVYFLQNGFPECVEWNSGVPRSRVHIIDRPGDLRDANRLVLHWDEKKRGLVRIQ